MKKKILRNWGLKLISPVIAFMLWFLVVSTDNPKDTQIYVNIPVTLKNLELLERENKAYEVLDKTDVVRVSVRAPKNVFGQLRASDIVAEADVSKLTDINTIAITCSVPNFDVESVTASPAVMRLNIEEKSSPWVRVTYSISGEVAEGYAILNTSVDLNQITISGPKSQVDQVSYAGVKMDVSGATSTQSANAEVVLYNVKGEPIELKNVQKSTDYVHMEVEILPTKEVPVELNVMGEPAEGFLATGVAESNPETVRVAGTLSALNYVRKISVPAELLDITDLTANLETSVNLKDYIPSNIRFADSSFNGRAAVTVYIEPEVERTLAIPEGRITVFGMPDDMTYEHEATEETYLLTVFGLGADVSALTLDDLICTIDLKEWMESQKIVSLRPGTYTVPVKVAFADNSALKEKVVLEDEFQARLIIEEWEDE